MGMMLTPRPMRMRDVRWAMAAAMMLMEGMMPRAASKWSSPSQTESKPRSSASSIW